MADYGIRLQVVADAARPHEQADWWAQMLGWLAEETDPVFIRKMIAKGYATDSDTVTYRGQLVWRTGAISSCGMNAA